MAISNLTTLTKNQFDGLNLNSAYTLLAPVVSGTGTQNSSLNTYLYNQTADTKQFAMQLGANGQDLALSAASEADQLNLACTTNANNNTPLYVTFRADPGWSDSFSMTLSMTNTDSSKGTMKFTKGKGEKPRPHQ